MVREGVDTEALHFELGQHQQYAWVIDVADQY